MYQSFSVEETDHRIYDTPRSGDEERSREETSKRRSLSIAVAFRRPSSPEIPSLIEEPYESLDTVREAEKLELEEVSQVSEEELSEEEVSQVSEEEAERELKASLKMEIMMKWVEKKFISANQRANEYDNMLEQIEYTRLQSMRLIDRDRRLFL